MARVYVGDLSHSAEKADLEREFSKYGTLKDVWVAKKPPGFAFIVFDDPRDADVCRKCRLKCVFLSLP